MCHPVHISRAADFFYVVNKYLVEHTLLVFGVECCDLALESQKRSFWKDLNMQGELSYFFMKLHSWREESQREFSNIMNSQGTIVDKGIDKLIKEHSDMKLQLSIITQERNDLLETVESLNVKLHSFSETSQEVLDLCTKEVGGSADAKRNAIEQDEEDSGMSNDARDQDADEDVNEETVTYQPIRQPITIPLTNHNNDAVISPSEEDITEVGGSHHLKETWKINEHEKKTNNMQHEDAKIWKTHIISEHNMAKKKLQCGGKISDPTCRQPNGIPCPYTSDSASHMKEHMEAVHEKIKNHFCKDCDYTSYRKGQLNRHVKVVHAKTGRYVCEECGHAEHRKFLFNSHMTSVHKM